MSLQTRLSALITAIGADIKSLTTGKLSRSPTVNSTATTATLTPSVNNDVEQITAQAAALAIANPSGTPGNAQILELRIKDNGTARAISWGTAYRSCIGVALPTTTTAGKWHRLLLEYHATDSKWDLIATATEV